MPNVKVTLSQAPNNLGMGIGRKIAHKHYNDEDYYVQVDAHTRFNKNWDRTYINQIKYYQAMGIEKPILTCYPKNYWYLEDGSEFLENSLNVTLISFHEKPELFKNFRFTSQSAMPNSSGSIYTRSVSGGSIFTVGPFIEPNSKILAGGEELVIAARAYTHGYDLVLPRSLEIWHLYYNHNVPEINKRRLAWNDYPEITNGLDQVSQSEIKRLFLNAPIGEEEFGTERTLEEFGKFVGLDFVNGEIVTSECCG